MTKSDMDEKLKSGKFKHIVSHRGDVSDKYITKYVLDLKVAPVIIDVRIYASPEGKFDVPFEHKNDKGIGDRPVFGRDRGHDRICTFINPVNGNRLYLSPGSVYGFCKRFAKGSAGSVTQIEDDLMNSPSVSTDATFVTENGKQAYVRNFRTKDVVLYEAMEKKSLEALKGDSISYAILKGSRT